MPIYLVKSNIFCIFVSVKQKATDISEAISSLAKQIELMQNTIDSQHATICQINRTSQCQLKEIRDLKRLLKKKDKEVEELRKRLSKYEEPSKNSGNSSTPPSKEPLWIYTRLSKPLKNTETHLTPPYLPYSKGEQLTISAE